jgi:hypothetical protein
MALAACFIGKIYAWLHDMVCKVGIMVEKNVEYHQQHTWAGNYGIPGTVDRKLGTPSPDARRLTHPWLVREVEINSTSL